VACSPVMASRTLRLAAAALVGLPAFAAVLSGQRGLTHHTSCIADAGEPFSVIVDNTTGPIISSAMVLTADAPIPEQCNGFSLALSVQPAGKGRINVIFPVENTTGRVWHGTALLTVNDVTTPVALGELRSDRLTVKKVTLSPRSGESTISAKLVVGI
jgi:hypothetical protein